MHQQDTTAVAPNGVSGEKLAAQTQYREEAAHDTGIKTAADAAALRPRDRKAEAKLRLKIDLYIIPTVAMLYLFCFIDVCQIPTRASATDGRF